MTHWIGRPALRIRLTRDAARVVVEMPGGGGVLLSEAAARHALRDLEAALTRLGETSPAVITPLPVLRRRRLARTFQRLRYEVVSRRRNGARLLLLAALFYPLPWILCLAPAVALLAEGAARLALVGALLGSLAAAGVAWAWARRCLPLTVWGEPPDRRLRAVPGPG